MPSTLATAPQRNGGAGEQRHGQRGRASRLLRRRCLSWLARKQVNADIVGAIIVIVSLIGWLVIAIFSDD